MKVLVVGGSGAVGRQLVPQLLAAGHHVIATSRSGGSAAEPTAKTGAAEHPPVWRRLNLLDNRAVHELVAEVEPDAIIHQATALSGLGNNIRKFDELFEDTIRLRTEGTAALLSAARAVGDARLIVQSFCGWPWAQVGGPVKTEEDPLDDNPPKAFRRAFAAIRSLEDLVSSYPNGVVLRYGGFYGPGTSLAEGGPQIKAIRKRQFPLVGSGAGVWSFVHVADAASAAVAALTRGRGIYNIVDDDPAPVRDWLPYLADVLGAPRPLRVPSWVARVAAGEGAVRMMTTVRGSSNAKAKRELGWSPTYSSWRQGFISELKK